MTAPRKCERCGVSEEDTEMGVLAYFGTRLVCDPCNADLENEWVAETGEIHFLDSLNPLT